MEYLEQEEQVCLASPTLGKASEERAYPPLKKDHSVALMGLRSLRLIIVT